MVYIKTWYLRNDRVGLSATVGSTASAAPPALAVGTGPQRTETDGDGDRDGDGTTFGWIRRQSSSWLETFAAGACPPVDSDFPQRLVSSWRRRLP